LLFRFDVQERGIFLRLVLLRLDFLEGISDVLHRVIELLNLELVGMGEGVLLFLSFVVSKSIVFSHVGVISELLLGYLNRTWDIDQSVRLVRQASDERVIRVIDVGNPCMLRLSERVVSTDRLFVFQDLLVVLPFSGSDLESLLVEVQLVVGLLEQVVLELEHQLLVEGSHLDVHLLLLFEVGFSQDKLLSSLDGVHLVLECFLLGWIQVPSEGADLFQQATSGLASFLDLGFRRAISGI